MLENFFSKSRKRASAPPGLRIYAIGDIHGCRAELNALTARIEADAADAEARNGVRAQLVFLGDYVDRGPDVKGVIDALLTIKTRRPDTVFLKGNHEAAMLDFLDHPEDLPDWLDWGGRETMLSYAPSAAAAAGPDNRKAAAALEAAIPAPHMAFFRSLKLYHEAEDYLFVHAGVRPGRPLAEQEEQDLLWIRSSFHNARPPLRPGRVVVHGHQPYDRPVDAGWRIGIDTGVYYSGMLSAVALEGARRWFISAKA